MKSAKTFLIAYFVFYFVVSIGLNALMGPPGFSEEYLEAHKAEHDRYMSLLKDADYKLYQEAPALNPATDANRADFEFADAYGASAAFQAEQSRRGRYSVAFDFFRAGMIVLLAGWFGAKPIGRFLDGQIALVREKLDKAEQARKEAETRIASARAQLASIDDERQRLKDEAVVRAAADADRIDETMRAALAQLEQEQADRVQYEELLARRAMKKDLVEKAIALLVEKYEADRTPTSEGVLVDRFVEQMEQVR